MVVHSTSPARRGTLADGAGPARQAQATDGPPSVEIHDILGNDEHVVVLGKASARARDGSSAEWKYTQIFHIRDGKTTEVWGMAENAAAVDPFLDGLPD